MDVKQSVDVLGQAVGVLAQAKQSLFSAKELMVLDQAVQHVQKVVVEGTVEVDLEKKEVPVVAAGN